MREALQHLFRFKAWANDELLTGLGRLGGQPHVTALAVKALSHSLVVDRIFAAHLRGTAHGYTSANLDDMPALEDLAADIRSTDREYIDYVSTLDREQLAERIEFEFTDGARGCMSREELLLHVIVHGAGHRGQVSALLLLNALPAAKDGFTTYLHESEPARRERAAA